MAALTWADRIVLSMGGLDNGGGCVLDIREGGPGAVRLRSYDTHDCHNRPLWQIQRWVDGRIDVDGPLTAAGHAALATIKRGEWTGDAS